MTTLDTRIENMDISKVQRMPNNSDQKLEKPESRSMDMYEGGIETLSAENA